MITSSRVVDIIKEEENKKEVEEKVEEEVGDDDDEEKKEKLRRRRIWRSAGQVQAKSPHSCSCVLVNEGPRDYKSNATPRTKYIIRSHNIIAR